MVEVVFFGWVIFFLFKINEWGLMIEFGMGFLILYGGVFGFIELLEVVQLVFWFCLGMGVLWCFDENNVVVFYLYLFFDIVVIG